MSNQTKVWTTATVGRKRQDTDKTVDYDLTQMSSDMVYATVYQMMIVTPEEHEGKTFRIDGNFYTTITKLQKYYFYCIIQDATAC